MAVVLPVASLVLLYVFCLGYFVHRREALLVALLSWGLVAVALTELLSLVSQLTPPALAIAWLVVSLALLAACRHWRLGRRAQGLLPRPPALIAVAAGLLLAAIGVTAVTAAPNHSDSMEYHLSRMMHWIQQGSVAHYPSHNLFHLYQNPGSEFAMVHLQLLSGGDRLSGIVQWVSLVGSMVGVSLIAKALGAGRSGQFLGSIFAITLPMAVLQGSSTNNDLVVALWIVTFVYFGLITMEQGLNTQRLWLLGTSLGLAILTKGTAYIYLFPFCLWLLGWGMTRLGWRAVRPLVAILAIAIAINAGHYCRNWSLFGSPLGAPGGEFSSVWSLPHLISNLLRQLALHADIVRNLHLEKIVTPTTGLTEKAITIIHSWLGVDISSPLTTSAKSATFYVPGLSFNEDKAGNPLHLLLIFLASGPLFCWRRLRQRRSLLLYWLATAGSFILFCQLLTWSTSRGRLHLPIFILFAALVGTVLERCLPRQAMNLLTLVLVVLAYQWALYNQVRPLLGANSIYVTPRLSQYFRTQPALEELYIGAAAEIAEGSCDRIGLDFENSSFEYPYWPLLTAAQPEIEIQHVRVTNLSRELADQDLHPCRMIKTTSGSAAALPQEITLQNRPYQEIWRRSRSENGRQRAVQIFAPTLDLP